MEMIQSKTLHKNQHENPLITESISSINFSTGHRLVIDQIAGELRLINKDEVLQCTIFVQDAGVAIDVKASKLDINTVTELNLTSKKINIEASEQLNIKSGGNLFTEVKKDALIEVTGTQKVFADAQKLVAKRGNIELKANDDIRLDGERVKLNCD